MGRTFRFKRMREVMIQHVLYKGCVFKVRQDFPVNWKTETFPSVRNVLAYGIKLFSVNMSPSSLVCFRVDLYIASLLVSF